MITTAIHPLFPSMFYLFGALFLIAFAAAAPAVEYAEGQVWQYDTREGEEASRLYIVRVDELPTGERIYHVFVDGIAIRNSQVDGGVQTVLPHAPIGRETLDASVTELEREGAAMPDISEGYAVWREAFDAGEGGYFTVSVAEILDFMEQALATQ